MNCPGAMLAYKENVQLSGFPIRMAEMGQVHRHELSGALHGLMRVRTFTRMMLIFSCFRAKSEIAVIDFINYVYSILALNII